MSDTDLTRPNPERRAAERPDARTEADVGSEPEPTPEEARAADENVLDKDVPEHYEEMTERAPTSKVRVA